MHFKSALTIIVLAIGLFFGIIISEALAAGNIKWHSYQEGVALGKQKNKKVFVNFFADWCTYCKQMDSETFADSAVGAFMNKNFIAVKVDADRETQLASEYHVQGLPVSTFIAEDGRLSAANPASSPPTRWCRCCATSIPTATRPCPWKTSWRDRASEDRRRNPK